MDLTAAAELAWELLAKHELNDWSFDFDRARRRAGAANFSKQQITISRELTKFYSADQVRDIILHEIAHALVGANHAHDNVWRAKCLEIGAKPAARLREDPRTAAASRPNPLWIGSCPSGHTINRYRRPRTPQSCGQCARTFSAEYLISWRNTRTGEIIS
ncbi:SprT-like domain-containing protein [Arcanobacterium hippocoleae]